MKRSDLICENASLDPRSDRGFIRNYEISGIKCTEVTIDAEREKRLGRSAGRYFTLFVEEEDCGEAILRLLSRLLPREGSVLVVGLGNERISADSLGAKSLRHIPATAHLSEHEDFSALGLRKVYVLGTGVTGQTGIESARQVRLVADGVDAAYIVAVDALACAERDRLCRTIQVTDTGIEPGAGVGNSRRALNEKTVGRRVYAIGVPTVIDYEQPNKEPFMVTPRNIDRITDRYARLIGSALSRALNPVLTEDELSALLL
ncbi:MAG: GPR endopeptidase [Bacteroides sp.]|nr:GPR endopeptidase [Eubacterium sp.]MCM1418055.1 GPR endopeptidase [Roseburia sp.]MCM1462199.1 GPR endopeptidase [Bacteroides sp.]